MIMSALLTKVAVVIGGSSGMGLATVKGMAAQGCTVHMVSRNEHKLEEAKARLIHEGVDANLVCLMRLTQSNPPIDATAAAHLGGGRVRP
jgi:NAD(P)-dependent dehydrogenase (short-subunit alcohol dehydrogenase family)